MTTATKVLNWLRAVFFLSKCCYCSSRWCSISRGEYTHGRWVLEARNSNTMARHNKSFVCCGWDAEIASAANSALQEAFNMSSLCTSEHNKGMCLPIRNGNRHSLLHSGGHSCRCDYRDIHGVFYKSPRESYTWQPDSCELLKWNATAFCELLGNKVVLLTGDSTMSQTAVTLVNMITYGGGVCAENIHTVFSTYLTWKTNVKKCFVDFTLAEAHSRIKPNISIFTTGAHLQDLGDLDAIIFAGSR